MSLTISLAYPAALPVGSRVELTWVLKPAWRKGKPPKQLWAQPFVVDLDSGVRYAPHWMVGEFMTFRSDRPHTYASEPLPQFEVDRSVRGTVLSCTIVNVGGGEPYQHTMLELEPDAA